MTQLLNEVHAFTHDHRLAVGIARTSMGHHVGLIYATDTGTTILHQAFHHDLRRETPGSSYRWVRVAAAPQERLRLVARLCEQIWKRYKPGSHELLPYAFDYTGGRFNSFGRFLAKGGKGLTCATFVLAVFLGQGIELLAAQEWERRPDDDEILNQILRMLQRSDPAHAEALQNERGCVRFRPEEVVAAATSNPLPAGFEYAQTTGASLIDAMRDVATLEQSQRAQP